MSAPRRVEVIDDLLAAMTAGGDAELVRVLRTARPTTAEVDAATGLRRLDVWLTHRLGRSRHLRD